MATTFTSDKETLQSLLQSIQTGKTQLPDFQRRWVWDDLHIRDLLASVSLSYPIGAVMMLETGGADVKFKSRSIEGVTQSPLVNPERLILDGQQRLTSLFQSLFCDSPVVTKNSRGKEIAQWYYLDIMKALDPNIDREEAIIGLPADKILMDKGKVITDCSTIEKECEEELLPLSAILDISKLTSWQLKYLQVHPDRMPSQMIRWNNLVAIVQNYQQYQIPVITLKKETPKLAICQVFEKVNTGGVVLNVFELLTATYAVDDFNLQEDWCARQSDLKKFKVLENLENTDFLQAVTLLSTYRHSCQEIDREISKDKLSPVSCKRKDILKLTLNNYQAEADLVTQGFEQAAKFLHGEKIMSVRDLPYQTQLISLAAILAALISKGKTISVNERDLIKRWYWCGVFGELYGSATETRLAKDLVEVVDWIEGADEPDTVIVANFTANRLERLYTRTSAAYKGLAALLLRDNGQDFITGDTIDTLLDCGENIDIHHIFPRAWCEKERIDKKRYDSAINKTPLSKITNILIGGKAPSIYLDKLEKKGITPDRIDEILQSHVIDPQSLRVDNFDAFFHARKAALLDRISKAMGKKIVNEMVDFTADAPIIDRSSLTLLDVRDRH
jgi:hypothetical protein